MRSIVPAVAVTAALWSGSVTPLTGRTCPWLPEVQWLRNAAGFRPVSQNNGEVNSGRNVLEKKGLVSLSRLPLVGVVLKEPQRVWGRRQDVMQRGVSCYQGEAGAVCIPSSLH